MVDEKPSYLRTTSERLRDYMKLLPPQPNITVEWAQYQILRPGESAVLFMEFGRDLSLDTPPTGIEMFNPDVCTGIIRDDKVVLHGGVSDWRMSIIDLHHPGWVTIMHSRQTSPWATLSQKDLSFLVCEESLDQAYAIQPHLIRAMVIKGPQWTPTRVEFLQLLHDLHRAQGPQFGHTPSVIMLK